MHGSSLLVFPTVRTGANILRASRPYAELLCRECNAFSSTILRCGDCVATGTGLGYEPVNSPQHYLPVATPENCITRGAGYTRLVGSSYRVFFCRAAQLLARRLPQALRLLRDRLLCSAPRREWFDVLCLVSTMRTTPGCSLSRPGSKTSIVKERWHYRTGTLAGSVFFRENCWSRQYGHNP